MQGLLIALGAGSLVGALFLVGEVVTAPQRERQVLLRRARRYGEVRVRRPRESVDFKVRALEPLKAKVARLMLRINPQVSLELVANRLAAAGMHDVSPEGFLAAKGLCAGGGVLLGMAVAVPMGFSASGLMMLAVFGAAGYMAVPFIVSSRARRRRDQIVASLPDALDLLAVSVEAGMGFDGAIAKLTEHMDGPLTDEFSIALGEMRIGESRAEALKRLTVRADTPEVGAFVRSLIQADQLGISLGRILKLQAQDTRLKRQMAAEERAGKAPIKMLFPTVMFIFPSMFIVILGPALIGLKQVLGF
jgi:tight adherence protein C